MVKKRVIISVLLTIGAVIGTYKMWHHTSPLLLISILILSFLLAYKMTAYVADFKTIGNHSRIDIIFLLIFCVFLCIPASHISDAKKAKNENRYLASKAIFIKNKKLNLNYGKDFNNWFNDRFSMRNNLIRWNTILKCNINSNYCTNGKVTYYKKGHFIYGNIFGMEKIKENKQEVLNTYAGNINRLQNYCDKNNIKLYILIIPRQSDFFDYPLADKRKYEPDNADEVIDYLLKKTKTHIIYPKEAMMEANKETPVYFKTDHHWTKKGAYVGYYELMKEIRKDFPTAPVLEESSLEKYYDNRISEWWNREFNYGQKFIQLGLPRKYAKKILDTPYLYYKNPNREKLQTDIRFAPIPKKGYDSKQDNQFYYPDGLDKKVMVIGNSFAANLVEFLPYSFKYTARYYDNYRYMLLETYKEVFDEYKPDILIINMFSSYTNGLLNLYPNKYRWKEVK